MSNFIMKIVMTSCLVLLGGGMAWAQTVAHSALFGTVLEYPTTGCNGAVVQTPLPGKQFSAPALATPAWVTSFYAQTAARHVTWLTSLQCTHTGLTHDFQPALGSLEDSAIGNGYLSNNWSGFQIANTAQFTQTGWTIPTVVHPHPAYSSNYYSSTWTGIGGGVGAGSGPLIQSGSSQHFLSTGAEYYFWYEIVGGPTDTAGEVMIASGTCAGCLTAHPGDAAGSVSIWTPKVSDPTVGPVTLGVCDFSDNDTCVNIAFNSPTNPTPKPGNTTEWIVEAPSDGVSTLPLADFDSVNFIGDCWSDDYAGGTGTCYTISQGTSPASITLKQTVFGISQTLASPTPLNGDGSFTDYYYQPENGH